tara:strand:- start:615 stop:1040 length:426 start_codon:yes stop_codon:yes gene_type:complete
MESENYSHKQMSTYLYVVLVPLFLGLSIWALSEGIFGDAVLVLGVGTALLLLFGSLRVEVSGDLVRLFFGLGIIHRTINREKISSVKQVRNSWWFGFGVRYTPHGWMWNASGLDAVEITYKNGKKFRIGTDDPEGLLSALS